MTRSRFFNTKPAVPLEIRVFAILVVRSEKMRYEFVREIFNLCSGNQMRDVFVKTIETDNLDEFVKQYLVGGDVHYEKKTDGGAVIYDLLIDGLTQRLSFTED